MDTEHHLVVMDCFQEDMLVYLKHRIAQLIGLHLAHTVVAFHDNIHIHLEYEQHVSSSLGMFSRNKTGVSCRRHMPHLGLPLNSKRGTAGQAFRHEEIETQEVAL